MSDTRAPELDHEDVSSADPEQTPADSGSPVDVPGAAPGAGPGAASGAEPAVGEVEAAPSRAPRARRSSRTETGDRGEGTAVGSGEEQPVAAQETADEDDDVDPDQGDGGSGGSSDGGSRRGKVSLRRLEEEGEVAADYLEELLDIVDLDGDIDIDVENGRASVAVVAEPGAEPDLRRLVGGNGVVLEALQELARLAVQARTGERSRLMLDVVGYRAGRRRALAAAASRACEEVARTGAPVRMDPMSAFERKVVHDVVADAGLVSESEGEEPGRRVVIHPAGA